MIPNCKKEVDIKLDTDVVYWNGNKTDLNFFQGVLSTHNKGKNVLIITKANNGARPTVIPFYTDTEMSGNKYILTSTIDSTRVMTFSNEGHNQLQLVQSRIDITITDGAVSKVDYILTAGKSFDYLDATSPNTNVMYTPTVSNHPATKKYVDDAISSAITSALEVSY